MSAPGQGNFFCLRCSWQNIAPNSEQVSKKNCKKDCFICQPFWTTKLCLLQPCKNPQLSVETTLHCYSHQQKDKVVSIVFLAATQRIDTVVWYLYYCKIPVIRCVGLLVGFDHEMAWFTWEPNNLKALIFKVWHPNKAYVAKNKLKIENGVDIQIN